MPTDAETRGAVLLLHKKGYGLRAISQSLGLSRNTVRRIVRSQRKEVVTIERTERLTEHDARIRELFATCEGNRQRVHEELAHGGVAVPYATLTAYCRRHGLGVAKKQPAGTYVFSAGKEMQHDTSPHTVLLGASLVSLQCASLVLCYSRRRYVQLYRRWTRFWVKSFLTAAFRRFEGVAEQCMLDNSHVVLAGGTGANAIVAPEMVAFAKRFDFTFVAHEKGDANRSAHVERGFDYVSRNFYPGRKFVDLDDANAQLIEWCDKDDLRPRRALGNARPIDLFVAEKPNLKPLPLYVPEPSQRWDRTVDTEGYVHLHTNRYSAPLDLLEHDVVVYESKSHVRIFKGLVERCAHARLPEGARQRAMLPEHEAERRRSKLNVRALPRPEESRLRAASPVLGRLVTELKARQGGRATRLLRQLDRMWKEYPTEPLCAAVEHAMTYGLFDLERIERMVLERVAGDYFRLDDLPSISTADDSASPEDDQGLETPND